jgi:hypothetical protein
VNNPQKTRCARFCECFLYGSESTTPPGCNLFPGDFQRPQSTHLFLRDLSSYYAARRVSPRVSINSNKPTFISSLRSREYCDFDTNTAPRESFKDFKTCDERPLGKHNAKWLHTTAYMRGGNSLTTPGETSKRRHFM